MRILLAPTAFKGSLSPVDVAVAMSKGVELFTQSCDEKITVDLLPIADGGDGTIEALSVSSNAKIQELSVIGSCNEIRKAYWMELEQYAVVELASACGIAGLDPSCLLPLTANTRGLGQVLRHVVEKSSAKDIVIALGGSASTDGGSGALVELGARFFDIDGNEFRPSGGADLLKIERCDLSAVRSLLKGKNVRLATDVENVLLGPNGAAHVFGPQKGASPEQVIILDEALSKFADLIEKTTAINCRQDKGTGAAGGTAFGLAAGLCAEIISGFSWMSATLGLAEKVQNSDLVITGEGRVDLSSLQGKVVGSLHVLCQRFQKPLWIMAGSVSPDTEGAELGSDLILGIESQNKMADAQDISRVLCETLKSRFKS